MRLWRVASCGTAQRVSQAADLIDEPQRPAGMDRGRGRDRHRVRPAAYVQQPAVGHQHAADPLAWCVGVERAVEQSDEFSRLTDAERVPLLRPLAVCDPYDAAVPQDAQLAAPARDRRD